MQSRKRQSTSRIDVGPQMKVPRGVLAYICRWGLKTAMLAFAMVYMALPSSASAVESVDIHKLAGHLVFIGKQQAPSTTGLGSRIYSLDLAGVAALPQALTPVDRLVSFLTWDAHTSKVIYFADQDHSKSHWHVLTSLDRMEVSTTDDAWPNGSAFYLTLSLSPDGRYIAGVRENQGNGLWVVDTTGAEPAHQIEGQAGSFLSAPAWAPDDSKIVFPGSLKGNINYIELFAVDRDGKHLRQLTDLPSWISWWTRLFMPGPKPPRWDNHFSTEPRWSPDGQWVVFQSFEGVYRMRPDGSDLTLIVKRAVHPAWSPDGKMLAYVADRGQSQGFAIYVSLADGSDEKQITDVQTSMNYSSLYWVN